MYVSRVYVCVCVCVCRLVQFLLSQYLIGPVFVHSNVPRHLVVLVVLRQLPYRRGWCQHVLALDASEPMVSRWRPADGPAAGYSLGLSLQSDIPHSAELPGQAPVRPSHDDEVPRLHEEGWHRDQ